MRLWSGTPTRSGFTLRTTARSPAVCTNPFGIRSTRSPIIGPRFLFRHGPILADERRRARFMTVFRTAAIVAITALVALPNVHADNPSGTLLKAFPGAEGFGGYTPGGR